MTTADEVCARGRSLLHAGEAPRFTDKLPHNGMYAPLTISRSRTRA
jgi:hypothetical protein